jgi:hypothetical protein
LNAISVASAQTAILKQITFHRQQAVVGFIDTDGIAMVLLGNPAFASR